MYTAPQIQALLGQYWPVLVVIGVWTIIWKGMALWQSARNGHKVWFVVLLLINTVGILEIIYIFAVGRRQQAKAVNPTI
jgi:methionyl-tRNA synthetase